MKVRLLLSALRWGRRSRCRFSIPLSPSFPVPLSISNSPARSDPLLKPPELQALVENFCLGTRRLHLYGSPHSLRRGWLTVGADFDAEKELVVKPVAGEEDNSDWKPRLYEREAFERVWSGSGKRATVGEREGEALREGDEHEQVASLLPFVQGAPSILLLRCFDAAPLAAR